MRKKQPKVDPMNRISDWRRAEREKVSWKVCSLFESRVSHFGGLFGGPELKNSPGLLFEHLFHGAIGGLLFPERVV